MAASRLGQLAADAPQGVGRLVAEDVEPGVVGEPEDPGRLAEIGGQLGLQRVLPDADAALERGRVAHPVLHLARQSLGVVGVGPEERLVPAEHVDRHAERAQRRHHLGRRRVVRLLVDGQEDGVRCPPGGGAQRDPGVHAERPRLVGGGAHDTALGGVAVTADHDGQAAQLRSPQDLDGRDELVEVDVQDPAQRVRPRRVRTRKVRDGSPGSSSRGGRGRWCRRWRRRAAGAGSRPGRGRRPPRCRGPRAARCRARRAA